MSFKSGLFLAALLWLSGCGTGMMLPDLSLALPPIGTSKLDPRDETPILVDPSGALVLQPLIAGSSHSIAEPTVTYTGISN
jgi:hypothetical protein